MNKEIKDFFVRNRLLKNNTIEVNNYEFDIYNGNNISIYKNHINIDDIENITLDRLKALIYGLTGKQLE